MNVYDQAINNDTLSKNVGTFMKPFKNAGDKGLDKAKLSELIQKSLAKMTPDKKGLSDKYAQVLIDRMDGRVDGKKDGRVSYNEVKTYLWEAYGLSLTGTVEDLVNKIEDTDDGDRTVAQNRAESKKENDSSEFGEFVFRLIYDKEYRDSTCNMFKEIGNGIYKGLGLVYEDVANTGKRVIDIFNTKK